MKDCLIVVLTTTITLIETSRSHNEPKSLNIEPKAKKAIAEFEFHGIIHKDALKTLNRKFGQQQTVVNAHLEKQNCFPPMKMHKSDIIINSASII